jgi:lipid-A-disaccharide synthase
LPRLVGAASKLVHDVPGVQFLVARAPALDDALFAPLDHLRLSHVPIGILSNAADDVLAACDVVITASGTATVQSALHQRPMVIVYRVSPMTYALLKPFVQVASYGMVNLVAGRPVVTELIQDGCTPESIAREARSLLIDPERARRMQQELADVVVKLGGPGASDRAAASVLQACR